MFDTINWADSLPFSSEMVELGLDKNSRSYQTKDLEEALLEYMVQGGKLFLKRFRNQEWIEGDPKAKSLLGRIGHMSCTDEYYEEVDVGTRTIRMYDFREDVQGQWDCFFEFDVVIVKGAISEVKLASFEKTDSSHRKEQRRQWLERDAAEARLWYNRFFFHTKVWRKIRRPICRSLQSTGQFLSSLSHKIP
jgi:hypothetical protein